MQKDNGPQGKDSVLILVVTNEPRPQAILGWEPLFPRKPIFKKIPGGEVEPGESPEQACIRELKEETGIEVKPCEIKLQSKTPQEGKTGLYDQYLYLTQLSPDRVAGHRGKVVTCFDPDHKRIDSTCFDLASIPYLKYMMPKHLEMLMALV